MVERVSNIPKAGATIPGKERPVIDINDSEAIKRLALEQLVSLVNRDDIDSKVIPALRELLDRHGEKKDDGSGESEEDQEVKQFLADAVKEIAERKKKPPALAAEGELKGEPLE